MMKQGLFFILIILQALAAIGQYIPLEDRIKNHLFITVTVNKSECYAGEPIIATYKLYSALESESTILKYPSFYGFSFRDIISPRDNVVTRETIDGKHFDVHTIKKVQLTPNETGKRTIDALTMGNKIRVLDDNGRKIDLLEGVLEDYTLDGDYIHFNISSIPIHVNVLAPDNPERPMIYNGVAGDFRMNVQMSKPTLVPDERGVLTIVLTPNKLD